MAKNQTPGASRLDEAWLLHRTHLIGLAYGMLGDIGAAEDAVQEAFARLSNTEFDRIEDERGWLTVVTSRICLDQIRSARARHEQVRETDALESIGAGPLQPPTIDPADRVTLDDEVRLALLVVLQRLTPPERVVFVLHDIFQMPFDSISDTIGRPAPTCRQLARRARGKVAELHPHGRTAVAAAEHRLVAEQFIQACTSGDLERLIHTLDPDVTGVIDLGPSDPRTGQVFEGAPTVAANIQRYLSRATLVVSPVLDRTVVLAFVERRLFAVFTVTFGDGLVTELDGLADPEKMRFLDAKLLGASSM